MNNRPIGVFDSGLGGLTAVRELRTVLPGEDIVYFGDTGRVPYGARGRDIIIAYAKQDIAFLLSQNVKTIIAACGTVSSTLPQAEVAGLPVPYTGVVPAAVQAAVKATQNGKIGVIGTTATIQSGCYQNALAEARPGVQISAADCPLFVPLVENGHFQKGDALAALAVAEYLQPIKQAGVDTLIMGCTHYPLLRGAIREYMGEGVVLIDVGCETADTVKDALEAQGMLADKSEGGRVFYFVTDAPTRFDYFASLFLGGDTGGPVRRINIEEYSL